MKKIITVITLFLISTNAYSNEIKLNAEITYTQESTFGGQKLTTTSTTKLNHVTFQNLIDSLEHFKKNYKGAEAVITEVIVPEIDGISYEGCPDYSNLGAFRDQYDLLEM